MMETKRTKQSKCCEVSVNGHVVIHETFPLICKSKELVVSLSNSRDLFLHFFYSRPTSLGDLVLGS